MSDPPADPTDKGKHPRVVELSDSEPESADEGAPEAASSASASKNKKKSKKKNAASPTAVATTSGSDNPLADLPPEQMAELLSKNPALANEFAAMAQSAKTGGGLASLDPDKVAEFMKKLQLQDVMTGLASTGKGAKDMASYKFWQTQPVPKFGDQGAEKKPDGPIKIQTLEEVSKTPAGLIDGFEWVTLDLKDEHELKEVYELLNGHYVEDDEAMFRFNYSPSILKWALMSPGWRKEWHVGVRASVSRKLVAFIGAIPTTLRVRENKIKGSEVNFICVHKKLRGKRLAPVLIKEVTRLINLQSTWQAIYTAGVVLPKPVSTCRYYHRALNWEKLHDIKFSPLPPGFKPQQMVRKYAMPAQTRVKGIRPMEARDIDAVHDLLERYLKRFDLVPEFDKEEIEHWMVNKNPVGDQVIYSYVVETNGKITDLISFYALESSIINHPKHSVIRAAYLFYYATETGLPQPLTPSTTPATTPVSREAHHKRLNELVFDILVIAKQFKFDVFNALSLMDNGLFLEEQKFGPGDGQLHYYLFNYWANFIRGGVDRQNRLDKDGLSGVGFVMM